MIAARCPSRSEPQNSHAFLPRALTRKNALFAGSDGGGEHWATIASLVETCKLSGVDPQAWFADLLTKLAGGHPITKLDEMLPRAFARQAEPAVA